MNRDNSVGVVNLEAKQLTATIPVGNAPRSIVLHDNKAYVTNVGGKKAGSGNFTKNWKDSAIFITEDDSQNGVDHVDGHRAPVHVISPWVKRGVTYSNYFTIVNMVRSIEQILGLPAMNQNEAAALPMSEIFTNDPDFTPYQALPNNVPLDTLNGQPSSDKYALAGTDRPTQETNDLAKAWTDWSNKHREEFVGTQSNPDRVNANMMNHATCYATKGFNTPFPGENKVLNPDEVAKQPASKETSDTNND